MKRKPRKFRIVYVFELEGDEGKFYAPLLVPIGADEDEYLAETLEKAKADGLVITDYERREILL